MAMSSLVLFDGDDTLWLVEPLYDAARAEIGRIVTEAGLDATAWESLQRRIDVQSFTRLGFSPNRFPMSCVKAYERLARSSRVSIGREVRDEIHATAARVFRETAPTADGAKAVLHELSERHRLALLTQGDHSVQTKRLNDSGLESFFENPNKIVPEKNAAVFRDLLNDMAAIPTRSWSVGNSLASDINPALECGMSAIWVAADHWEYERREVAPSLGHLYGAESLPEVADILDREAA